MINPVPTRLQVTRGSTLILVLVLTSVVSLIVISSFKSAIFQSRMATRSYRFQQSLNVAEAGIEFAIQHLRFDEQWVGWDVDERNRVYQITDVYFGDADEETIGQYDITIRDYPGLNPIVESTGYVPGKTSPDKIQRTVKVTLDFAHPLYHYAVFAGNSSGDPDYVMGFGGGRFNGDRVNGDVYSDGDVLVEGRSFVDGDIDATGLIDGASGNEGFDRIDPPDMEGMNYAAVADVDVAAAFANPDNLVTLANSGIENFVNPDMTNQVTTVFEEHPAHIFAKDVLSDYGPVDNGAPTTNENYFLGDWHAATDGEDITVDAAGNNQIYYVDGNLWIETNGYGPRLTQGPTDGIQITIVAKGNIYIADQLLYENAENDGIAFIAVKDGECFTDIGNGQYDDWEVYDDQNSNQRWDTGEPYTDSPDWQFTPGVDTFVDLNGNGVYDGNNENSGNVYFGDPNYGPVGQVDGFLYAENNFVDCNINEQHIPQDFTINGNMTAGNHLRINRDYLNDDGALEHTEMTVNYDSRLEDGSLLLPGLPKGPTKIYTKVASWLEI